MHLNPSADPFLRPAFSVKNRIARFSWGIVYATLFRPSLRPLHGWRRLLLRAFGAKVGSHTHIYPRARIWAPWNLTCGDYACIGDGAVIYNPQPVVLGTRCIVSQDAYICGATHDYNDPTFPLVSAPIVLGAYSWVCARATVQCGVTLEEGAVLALGAVATRDIESWSVYGGVPARRITCRTRVDQVLSIIK